MVRTAGRFLVGGVSSLTLQGAGETPSLTGSPGWRQASLPFWTPQSDLQEDAWRTWGGEKGQDGRKQQPSILEVSHSYSFVLIVLRSREVPGWCPLEGPQLSCSGDLERLGVLWEG